MALQLSLLRRSRPKSARASPRQCAQSAQNATLRTEFIAQLETQPVYTLCIQLYINQDHKDQ